jgi:hypothetical protein
MPSKAKAASCFDFEHVESALAYFDSADEQILRQIADSRATQHLLAHSERTGYYATGTTGLELTRALLGEPEEWRTAKVKTLTSYLRANADRQTACLAEAKQYLPARVEMADRLHLTWGYDIGVAMDGSALLNLAHDHFLEDPQEVWFFCIHEMHHAGVTSLHPMVRISGIATTQKLFEFLKYSTFLEGTATYAAYDARAEANALGKDRDYVALQDEIGMDRYRAEYFETYKRLESAPDRPVRQSDWQAIENLSDGDRLWYRVGAEMTATIDDHLGRERLKEIISAGPGAFFRAYFALTH